MIWVKDLLKKSPDSIWVVVMSALNSCFWQTKCQDQFQVVLPLGFVRHLADERYLN